MSKTYYKSRVPTTKNRRTREIDTSLVLAETLKELRLSKKTEALKTGKQVPKRVFAFVESKVLHSDTFRGDSL